MLVIFGAFTLFIISKVDRTAGFFCCLPVPYVSEDGIRRLLVDLVSEDPRLAGRQPAEFIDSRYLREVEASGFLQTIGAAP